MRSPSSAFLCTFLVVFGYGACEYLEDRPELLKVYHEYLSSHPPKKLIPVGEVLYHADLNASMEYSKGFSGTYSEIEQSIYERVNPEVEKWSFTQTSFTVGKDERGPVHEVVVIDAYETVVFIANGYFWELQGDGTFYLRDPDGDYKDSGSLSIKGSGHAVYTEKNTTRIAYDLYEVIDYEGVWSDTTLVYGDLLCKSSEERLFTEGLETLQVEQEGKNDALPVQVNKLEMDEPLDGEGEYFETVDGMEFSEGNDVTFKLEGGGNKWTTKVLANQSYPKRALRHSVRSALFHLLRNRKSTRL